MDKKETTLHEIYKEAKREMTNEDIMGVNKRLLLLMQLSALQLNILGEIEHIFRKSGNFKFGVKHSHRKIIALVKSNGDTKAFFQSLGVDAIDMVVEDAEEIEKMLYEWGGIKPL